MIKKSTLLAVCAATMLLHPPNGMAQDASPSPSADASASPAADASPSATAAPSASVAASAAPQDRFAAFQQRMNDQIKTALKASDDEWAVIQPLLEKVQTAQRAAMMGGGFGRFGGGRRGFGGGGGPGGPGGPGGNGGGPGANAGSPRPGMAEADALRTALQSDATSNDEIKTKLQALRDARKKAQDTLEQAREDLKKVLTLRQEATLVQMGLLD